MDTSFFVLNVTWLHPPQGTTGNIRAHLFLRSLTSPTFEISALGANLRINVMKVYILYYSTIVRSVLEKYWSSPFLHRSIDRDPGKVHK